MITVVFAGLTYEIPEDEETGWEDLTNFLVAVAQNAAVIGATAFGGRISTSTPQTLQTTDTVLVMNVASASVVNVPVGVEQTVYGVFDGSNAANTNPITVTLNGAEVFTNGSSTYVIDSNGGGLLLQFVGGKWRVISEVGNVFKSQRKIENNTTNASFVEAAIVANGAFAASADGTSCSATFGGSNAILLSVALSTGEYLLFSTSFAAANLTALSDQSGLYLNSDAGTGIYVSKSAASGVITVKNRMGGSRNIEVKALTNSLSSLSAWA
jgi:hypothetical protein